MIDKANIPMRFVGPLKIISEEVSEEIKVPLATFETPVWASVNRGARLSRLCQGIKVTVMSECMTRSVLLQAHDAQAALIAATKIRAEFANLAAVVLQTSKYAALQNIQHEITANLLYLRFSFSTGDAAGHNMTTKAADALLDYILAKYSELSYVSVSGNYCIDKKVSAVNGILGRGKNVIAEMQIPRELCLEKLHISPEKIIEINIKKNLMGSILAGSIRSANAHFANMLLALYLATGQDAANIIEGSQGFTYAEMQNDNLYFSVTLPNIIVGTVGAGKNYDFVKANLKALGCLEKRQIGANSRRLAVIAAATVLCGELSLLAALTNRHELSSTHEILER